LWGWILALGSRNPNYAFVAPVERQMKKSPKKYKKEAEKGTLQEGRITDREQVGMGQEPKKAKKKNIREQ